MYSSLSGTGKRAGIFERLERLVRQIRVAIGYTPAIGALLNIIPAKAIRANLSEFVPTITILATAEPYSFVVKTTRRNFKAFPVEVSRGSSDTWETAGVFTYSPAVVTIEPAGNGPPELLQVRLRMIENNYPAGNYSNIKIVTITP